MRTYKTIAVFLTSISFFGCNDDSNNATSTNGEVQTNNSAFIFNQPNDVFERSEITLDASNALTSTDAIQAYNWAITFNGYKGEEIRLNSNGATAKLIIGEIIEDVLATISLTVTNSDGSENRFSNNILVQEIDVKQLPALPSDPKQGVAGVDADGDGVRDDVEIKIYQMYPQSNDNREVSRYAAKAYQNVLITGDSLDDLDDDQAADGISKLVWCYNLHTNLNPQHEAAKIRSLVIDTAARLEAYEKFLMGRHGTAQPTVEATYEECRLAQNKGL